MPRDLKNPTSFDLFVYDRQTRVVKAVLASRRTMTECEQRRDGALRRIQDDYGLAIVPASKMTLGSKIPARWV